MPIRHLVLFSFTHPTDADRVATAFRELEHTCRRDGEPYLRGLEGGAQTATEPAGRHWHQGWVVTFDTEADRDHYIEVDPAHAAFGRLVGPLLRDVAVVDVVVPD